MFFIARQFRKTNSQNKKTHPPTTILLIMMDTEVVGLPSSVNRFSAFGRSSTVGNVRFKVKSYPEKLYFQIRLLLWKRYAESTKSKWDLMKLILPAVLFFVLLLLLYSVFDGLFAPDGIEPFFVPFAFWIFVQRIVIQIMYEKSTRLQESMRMMGLSDLAYWSSYFISDGIITGFLLSFICSIITTGGLFNNANFGEILGLLFVYCLSAVPFAFFLCSFFDTPQTSGQATLAILLGKL